MDFGKKWRIDLMGWIKGSTSPFGPNLIPIAKININNSYNSGLSSSYRGYADLRSLY